MIGFACTPPSGWPFDGTLFLQAFQSPPEVMDPERQFQILFVGGYSERIKCPWP